jgi:hypothetical protein
MQSIKTWNIALLESLSKTAKELSEFFDLIGDVNINSLQGQPGSGSCGLLIESGR